MKHLLLGLGFVVLWATVASAQEPLLVGSAIFGGIGAGAEAAIGMAARGTTWEEVPLPEVR